MSTAPWSVIDIFDDVNDKFNAFHLIFDDILDSYAPIKEVKIRSRPNQKSQLIVSLTAKRTNWLLTNLMIVVFH